MSFLVPKDTSDILQQNRKLPNRNLYLDFNKFIGEWQKKADDNGNLIEFNLGNSKNVIFENIIRSNYHSTDELLQKVTARNVEMIERYKQLKYDTCFLDNLSTQWRLAVGVGSSGPLETGMTLHHLYGFPYIPASSIKGIARACSYLLDENLSKLSLGFLIVILKTLKQKNWICQNSMNYLKNCLFMIISFPPKPSLK